MDLAVGAEEHRLTVPDVAAQGVDGGPVDGDAHRVDAGGRPCARVVGVGVGGVGGAGGLLSLVSLGPVLGGGRGGLLGGLLLRLLGVLDVALRPGDGVLRHLGGHELFIDGIQQLRPVPEDGVADRGPFAQPVVAGVVVGAPGDVRQHRVGAEPAVDLVDTAHRAEGAQHVEGGGDGLGVLEGGPARQLVGQVDEADLPGGPRGHLPLGVLEEGRPTGVVAEVVGAAAVVPEPGQQCRGGGEAEDTGIVAEERLPLFAPGHPAGCPEGDVAACGGFNLECDDSVVCHGRSVYLSRLCCGVNTAPVVEQCPGEHRWHGRRRIPEELTEVVVGGRRGGGDAGQSLVRGRRLRGRRGQRRS